MEALAIGIKNNAEAPAISIKASASAGFPHNNARQCHHKSRPDYERTLAALTWSGQKRLLERAKTAVKEAQAAHQTSTNVVADILGKDRALKILPDASDNRICGTGNDISTSSVDKDGPAAKRRLSSSTVDSFKVDRHTHLGNAEKHNTNTLSQDTNLSVHIHDALLDEKQTGEVLLAAKGRVQAV